MELALGLEPGFLQGSCQHARDYLRLLRYPGYTSALPHRQGISTHTDAGLFTLISCAGGSGLELLNTRGEWVGVRPESVEQLSVNIGDALMQWSNGVWRSTEHRVVLSEAPRRSIAFFKMVNDDAVVAPLPQFCVDRPPRYPPVVFRDHVEGTLSHPAVS
ncbi:MAG: isopenicillin N synthase family oxygenase [Alphaproteobacteria bacterium]|nr:isopenicillin N synthase family oxygenase [Alphaproteobacteria bacterium]